MTRLTDQTVPALPIPPTGSKIYYDAPPTGFGCRVTANGVRTFVLNYRNTQGRERRYSIGRSPTWTVDQARDRAHSLRRLIDVGEDPMTPLTDEPKQDHAKMAASLLDDFLTRDELATELRISPRTVMRWQAQPDGLPYVDLGGKTLYRRSSILAWLESRERNPNPRR